MLEILVLLLVLCVFRVTNVAAGFTYVHSFVMHAYKAGRTLSTRQFKQRVSQLLTSYSERKVSERFNYYQHLLRGMPARLAKCRANRFGPCGKREHGCSLRDFFLNSVQNLSLQLLAQLFEPHWVCQ